MRVYVDDQAELVGAAAAALLELRNWATDTSYGYGSSVENPHDFSPDMECCTPEEIENWKAACEQYDSAGAFEGGPEPCKTLINDNGSYAGIITKAPWGIGVYTYHLKEVEKACERLEEALARFGWTVPEEADGVVDNG